MKKKIKTLHFSHLKKVSCGDLIGVGGCFQVNSPNTFHTSEYCEHYQLYNFISMYWDIPNFHSSDYSEQLRGVKWLSIFTSWVQMTHSGDAVKAAVL